MLPMWIGFFDELEKLAMSLKPTITMKQQVPSTMKMGITSPSSIPNPVPNSGNKITASLEKSPKQAVGSQVAPPTVS